MSESRISPCIRNSNDSKSKREREKLPIAIYFNYLIHGLEDITHKLLVFLLHIRNNKLRSGY